MSAQLKRREFITLLGGAAVACPLAARAQQPASKIPRIGIIDPGAIRGDHFRQALRDLGYIEGQTVAFEYRSAEDKPDRLAAAASELAQLPVDVIVAFGTAAAYAAKQATTTIPIVMLGVGEPVRSGLVTSLARPGGNITGNTILGPAARRQTATAFQGGPSDHLARRFSLESEQRFACRLPRRVESRGSHVGRDDAVCRGWQSRRV